MSKEEKLKKVIWKAVKNGFSVYARNLKDGSLDDRSMNEIISSIRNETSDYQIIFSHDFAKAFWGIWESQDGCRDKEEINSINERWQYHLQQMVLLPEEKRIKYLEKFL